MAESGTGHSGPLRLYIVVRRLFAFIGFIEVIDVQNSEQEWMKQYGELLEAKTATLRAMPAEKRMALHQQWIDLHEEIKSSLDEDPAGTTAQAYADRWLDLLKQVSGVLDPSLVSMFASHEGQADAERFAKNLSEADRARARAAWQPVTDRGVWDFIHRAIALRDEQRSRLRSCGLP